MGPIAVIKTMTKGFIWFMQPSHSPLREAKVGTWKVGTEAEALGHLPRGSTTHSGLGPPALTNH